MRAKENVHIVGDDDERYIFRDSSYPYRSAAGRIQSSGSCTGTMIGRRLMVTSQHCVVDSNGNFAPKLSFSPAYYDGPDPYFGTAWAAIHY